MEKESQINYALCHQLPDGVDTADSLWLPLAQIGKFGGRDGREFELDDAELAINNTKLPFIVDVNHDSDLTLDTRASGWVKDLKQEAGIVYGLVVLNSLGRTAIADEQFKYYSPGYKTKRGKVEKILSFHSLALSNKPNFNVPALNSEQSDSPQQTTEYQRTEETPMIQKLLASLGLPKDADEQMALNAVAKLQEKQTEATPSLNTHVPREDYDRLKVSLNAAQAELDQLKNAEFDKQRQVALNAAQKAGIIAPATRGWHERNIKTPEDLVAFNDFAAVAPKVIGDSGIPETAPEGGGVSLNSEQTNLLAQMGLTPADLQEAK